MGADEEEAEQREVVDVQHFMTKSITRQHWRFTGGVSGARIDDGTLIT